MSVRKYGVIACLLALSQAKPITDVAKISKRDPCDGINNTPLLYHEYREAECPSKNKLAADGSCMGLQHFDSPFLNSRCSAFCQIRTSFLYATEVPFDNSYCHGPFTCTITNTDTVTYTIATQLSPKWFDAFGVGVAGTFTYAQANAYARGYQVKLETGQCGYFTFVPVRRDVCGTMTESTWRSSYGGGEVNSHCDSDVESIGNFCASDPRLGSDGKPDGETIFVKTDCGTRTPLPMDQQDEIYRIPGVSMDRGVLDGILSSWHTSAEQGNTCDVSYKFFYDSFEVRGKGWSTDEEGTNGDNLRNEISHCGKLTKWGFELTPDDPVYQWYAHGQLPIGTKACVGDAVVAAGGEGTTKDDCHGAG